MDKNDPTVLSWEESMQLAGGNESLARDLLTMMLDEFPSLISQLKERLQAGELERVAYFAHKMHGSTAYCGIPALRRETASLEEAIRSKELHSISESLRAVERAYQNLVEAFQAHESQG